MAPVPKTKTICLDMDTRLIVEENGDIEVYKAGRVVTLPLIHANEQINSNKAHEATAEEIKKAAVEAKKREDKD
jgi:hypothetical protein